MAPNENARKSWTKRILWGVSILLLLTLLIWGAAQLSCGGGNSASEQKQALLAKIAALEENIKLRRELDDCRGRKKAKSTKPPIRQHRGEPRPFQHRFDPDLVPPPDPEPQKLAETKPAPPAPHPPPPAPIIIEKERVRMQTKIVREVVDEEPEVEVRHIRRPAPRVVYLEDDSYGRRYCPPPLIGFGWGGSSCPPRWNRRAEVWSGSGGGNWSSPPSGGPHGVGTPGPSGGGPHGVGTPGPSGGGGGAPHGVGTPGPRGVGTPGRRN